MAKSKWKIVKSPSADGIGTQYTIKLAPGEKAKVVLAHEQQRVYKLGWVHVPPEYRGQGISNLLMTHVIADADRYHITLILTAVACAGLSQEKLESWYQGWGFTSQRYDRKLKGTKMVRRPKGSPSGYRRNSDEGLRDLERGFLNDLTGPENYSRYLAECRRLGVQPVHCACGQPASVDCASCSLRLDLPVVHCSECAPHLCKGQVFSSESPTVCNSDLNSAPICPRCQNHFCQNENCSKTVELEECHQCETKTCDGEQCAALCDECGVRLCSECWLECEAHDNTKYCSDCTAACDYCAGDTCPRCICGMDCGVNICTACETSGKVNVCNHCNERLCAEHSHECSCGETTCPRDGKVCKIAVNGEKCGNYLCEVCDLTVCSKCEKVKGCPEHFEECADCSEVACVRCVKECEVCSNFIDNECWEEHENECVAPPEESPALQLLQPLSLPSILPAPDSPTIELDVGKRVRHKQTGLTGTIIKVGVKDGIWKCIIEWDDDTAGKYVMDQITGQLRRY